MDKKTVNTILSVLLGIAVFVIIGTVISLFFDAVLAKDTLLIASPNGSVDKVILYTKNSSIGLICIAVPTLVCYCLTYFSKSKKVFGLISALLSLMLVAMSIGFIFDLRGIVLELETKNTAYSVATAYFSELIQMLTACGLTCAYFTVITVFAFRDEKRAAHTEQPAETAVTVAAEQGEQDNEKD